MAAIDAGELRGSRAAPLSFEHGKSDPHPTDRLDAIGALRFWESPDLLNARRRLGNAATISAARAVGARSGRARERFWAINEAANAWLFAAATAEDLFAVADALVREFLSAGLFERLEGNS